MENTVLPISGCSAGVLILHSCCASCFLCTQLMGSRESERYLARTFFGACADMLRFDWLAVSIDGNRAPRPTNGSGVCLTSPKGDLLTGSGTTRVLVGVTGSVAALKLPLLVSQLLELPGVDVRVVTTEHAQHFFDSGEITVKVYTDKDEWELWTQRSDPVLHIELRRWADLFVIAPLDANTLGKIASGICDNLLTCVARAWDTSRPLIFCPAMNTAMWNHPITARQIASLKDFGYVEIPCVVKKLVCGDEGKGAMAELSTIVNVVKEHLQKSESSHPT